MSIRRDRLPVVSPVGERGKAGDTGAAGADGARGARGLRGKGVGWKPLIGFGILLAIVLLGFWRVQQQGREICRNAQENRDLIRTLIVRGDPTLAKPGAPGYAYYQAHPVERRKAHQRTIETLKDTVPPLAC